jgi:hypothetical protein
MTLTPSATVTSTVTVTPTSTPTPVSSPTPALGDLIVHCFLDISDDGVRQWEEPGLWSCTILLAYQTGVQIPTYYQVVTGAGGVGVATLPPGYYVPMIRSYEAWPRVTPDYRQAAALVIRPGDYQVLHVPFVGPLPSWTPGPTPTVTGTPAPTWW